MNNLPNWARFVPSACCVWGRFFNHQKHCNVLTNLICKVEKVLEQPKSCCSPVYPEERRHLGARSVDAGAGSDGCERLRSELVEARDCVRAVASWFVLWELHVAGNPQNLALKGGKERCQTQVLSACSVPILPSARSSQRRAIAFLLLFHGRQMFFNSLEQSAGCPFGPWLYQPHQAE